MSENERPKIPIDENGRILLEDVMYVDYLNIEKIGGSKILRITELCKRTGWKQGDTLKAIVLKTGVVIIGKSTFKKEEFPR